MANMNPLKFYSPLGRLRVKAGLSQDEAAKRLGIKPMTLSRWERGRHKISERMQQKLAELYAVSWNDIIEASHPALVDYTGLSPQKDG